MVALMWVLMQKDVLGSSSAPTAHQHPPDPGFTSHIVRDPEGHPVISFVPALDVQSAAV